MHYDICFVMTNLSHTAKIDSLRRKAAFTSVCPSVRMCVRSSDITPSWLCAYRFPVHLYLYHQYLEYPNRFMFVKPTRVDSLLGWFMSMGANVDFSRKSDLQVLTFDKHDKSSSSL